MTLRAQPYRIEWPLNAGSVEQIDEMFQILFDDLRNGNLTVEPTQIDGVLGVDQGGTGLTSYAIGDILYADDTDSLARLNIGLNGYVLQSNGTAPLWGLVGFDNMDPALAASTLIGRRSGSAGNWEAITLGSGLSMSAGGELSASGGAPTTASYLTEDDETATLTGSRQLLAGTNISLDVSVAGEMTINATGGVAVGDGYWSPLTTGDPVDPELIFDGNGDTIAVWTAT